LEKSVNGQERRSLELFFKNFNDVTFNSVKFDQNAQMIKELAPLDNPKKDFSHLMDDLINKEEVNTMILNNIKNKRLSMLGRNSNEGNNTSVNNNVSNVNPNVLRPNNRDSRGNLPNQNNNSSNAGIKLTKANDFKGEVRDKSNNMIVDSNINDSHSQTGRTLRSSQNSMVPTNPKKQTGSILDFIKKSSESHESVQDLHDDKLFDGVGLDRIEEESDELFNNNKKSNFENAKDNKKKRNFLIDDKNKNIKKKNNKLK
jgi:hypothetical protein